MLESKAVDRAVPGLCFYEDDTSLQEMSGGSLRQQNCVFCFDWHFALVCFPGRFVGCCLRVDVSTRKCPRMDTTSFCGSEMKTSVGLMSYSKADSALNHGLPSF